MSDVPDPFNLQIDRVGIAKPKIVHEFGHLVVGRHAGFSASSIQLICPDANRQVPDLKARTVFGNVNDSNGNPLPDKATELLRLCVAGLVAEDLAKNGSIDVATVTDRFLARRGPRCDLAEAIRILGRPPTAEDLHVPISAARDILVPAMNAIQRQALIVAERFALLSWSNPYQIARDDWPAV